MRVLLLVALLLTTQYGFEFEINKTSDFSINLSTETKAKSSISSKRQFIINEINDIDHDIKSFPLKLKAFQTELTEMNEKNRQILRRIDNHLLIVKLGDSDNPTVRKRADRYIEMKFGEALSNMKQEVEGMINTINQKIEGAKIDVDAIKGLIVIRNGYKAQLALMD